MPLRKKTADKAVNKNDKKTAGRKKENNNKDIDDDLNDDLTDIVSSIDSSIENKIVHDNDYNNNVNNTNNNDNVHDTDGNIIEVKTKADSYIEMLKNTQNPWGLSPKALESKRAALAAISIKNGLHARVPIICKADSCPYASSCQLLQYGMAPEGEYCSTELAQIELRSVGYAQDIEFDNSSFTDKALMSELITLDIMLERCKALMAKEGTPVIDMAIGIDQQGNEIFQPGVSKAWEAYEKISKKRDQTYQLLMVTRKDHKKENADMDAQSVSSVLQDVINSTIIES